MASTIEERYGPPRRLYSVPSDTNPPILLKSEIRRASMVMKCSIIKQHSIILPDKFYIHNSLKDLKDKDAETKAQVLKSLHREILYVPSSLLEERDKTNMCLLHRILSTFPESQKKDDESNEMIKLVLLKSNTEFHAEDKKILRLLKNYDKQEPFSVKFFQHQILNGEENTFMLRMLRSEEDYRRAFGNQKNFRDLLEVTFAIGSITTLEYLIKQGRQFYKPSELDHPVLHIAIHSSIYVKTENKDKYFACLNFVLKQNDTNINAKDINGDTALHLVRDENTLEMILNKQPLISLQNKKGAFPLHNVTLELLTNTLNSVVTNVPTRLLDDPNFWEVIKTKEIVLKNMIFLDFAYLCPIEEDVNILEFIKAINCTKHLTTAINHSIVTTMLELYWIEFKKWIKMERFGMFIALFPASLLIFNEKKSYLIVLSMITTLILIFEALKASKSFMLLATRTYKSVRTVMIEKYTKYQKKFEQRKKIDEDDETQLIADQIADDDSECSDESEEFTPMYRVYTFLLLDLPLLLLLILYSYYRYNEYDCNWIIGIAVIFVSFNITLFISYFNETVAHYLIMLLHVAFNGFKFLLSTFFILLGFALSLMMLMKDFDTLQEPIECEVQNIRENVRLNHFQIGKSVGLSILKTLIMATGDLNTSSLKFHYCISYLIFVVFMFAIPIVFMNLLNGLALEDVQQIKKEAKFMYRRFQLMFLCEVDYLIRNKGYFRRKFNMSPNLLRDHSFIGIKTTSCKVYSFERLNKHHKIGKLNSNIVKEITEIMNSQRKSYVETRK